MHHPSLAFVVTLLLIPVVLGWWCFLWLHRQRHRLVLRRLLRTAARRLHLHNDQGEGHRLTWWIDFGTLLGYVREGDIIADDNDVDLCVRIDSPADRGLLWRLVQAMAGDLPGSRAVQLP